jgi:hypothetical protein
MILLAEQAEAYLQAHARQREMGEQGLTDRHHDVDGSRREWAAQFQ